jgi:hypothetical protein
MPQVSTASNCHTRKKGALLLACSFLRVSKLENGTLIFLTLGIDATSSEPRHMVVKAITAHCKEPQRGLLWPFFL